MTPGLKDWLSFHEFSKYLLNVYYMLGDVLHITDEAMKKKKMSLPFGSLHFRRRTQSKQIIKIVVRIWIILYFKFGVYTIF